MSLARCYRILAVLTLFVSMVGLTLPKQAFAQGGTSTATLAGTITDDSGGRLPGVTVTVTNAGTNQSRTVVSEGDGLYRFAGLAPGVYAVSAELQGFATFERSGVTLNVGAAVDFDITMGLSTLEESIVVTVATPVIESSKTSMSTVITADQIEALPTRSRNYLDFALLTPGTVENVSTGQHGIGLNVAGARAKESALLVDGFWNTDESFTYPRQKYSQDAIAEFQVIGLGGTAEFGRAIGGIVSAVTKSGSNDFSGSAYGFFRDTTFNAQDALSRQRGVPKGEFDRQVFGGSVGGPLVRDRTFFFGAFERTQQNQPQDNNITAETAAALGLPSSDVGAIQATLRDTFGLAKVNHQLSPSQWLWGAFAYTRDTDYTFPGSFATRSKRMRLNSTDWSYQAGWTKVAGNGTWLHELRASYFPRDYVLDNPNVGGPPLTEEGQLRPSQSPTVTIVNTATFGGGSPTLAQYTKPTQVVYTSTISKRAHSIKFGVDVMFADFVYSRQTGPQTGNFTFSSLDNYYRGVYTTYAQYFGEPSVGRLHTYLSGYVQDSWQASDRLTLNYGLRYDVETLSRHEGISYGFDGNNIAPRLALSYDLTGRGRTVLKVSNGLYYDRIFQNPVTPTYLQARDTLQQVQGVWRYGAEGAPVFPATLANRDPLSVPSGVRDVYIPPDELQIPSSYQAIATLDHAFENNLATSVSVLYTRSRNKEMFFDTNIAYDETTGRWDAPRPDPRFRRIQQFRYIGKAEYAGLVLGARKRSGRFFFSGDATFARAYDQGDNINSQVQDPHDLEAEYAPGIDTPAFRATANGSYDVTSNLSVSGVFRVRTGFAYSAFGGNSADFNGDGTFNDRVPGTTRNEFRMPGMHSLDLRLTWTVPMRTSQRLQLTLDAFNLYNRDNVATVNSTWGQDPSNRLGTFGTPLSYSNPRELQLALRYTF